LYFVCSGLLRRLGWIVQHKLADAEPPHDEIVDFQPIEVAPLDGQAADRQRPNGDGSEGNRADGNRPDGRGADCHRAGSEAGWRLFLFNWL
jgi:hypothetical protein